MALPSNFKQKIFDLGMNNYCSLVVFELTGRCNASCDYCYICNKTCNTNRKDLPTEDIFKVIDKLDKAGVIHLSLTGGEIFIRRDILEILSYIIKKGFWTIGLLTNGTLIQDKHLHFMQTHFKKRAIIKISLFSHIPQIHDEYLGIPGALKKIEHLCKQLSHADIKFILSLNVLDFNYKYMDETIKHYQNLGYHIRIGINKIIVRNNCQDKQQSKFYNIQQNIPRLRKISSYKFYCNLMKNNPNYFSFNNPSPLQTTKQEKKLIEDRVVCHGLIISICIDFEGNIRPCLTFRNLKIGNIFQDGSLHELLQRSEKLTWLKSLRLSDIHPCKECKYSDSCIICLGKIHSESGQINNVSPRFCNYIHALTYVSKT